MFKMSSSKGIIGRDNTASAQSRGGGGGGSITSLSSKDCDGGGGGGAEITGCLQFAPFPLPEPTQANGDMRQGDGVDFGAARTKQTAIFHNDRSIAVTIGTRLIITASVFPKHLCAV